MDILTYVNDVVNASKYTPDPHNIWKAPEEFLEDGGGDCEDFAIMKYHLLKGLVQNLKIAFVLISGDRGKQAHMVCLARNLVLDNNAVDLIPEVDYPGEFVWAVDDVNLYMYDFTTGFWDAVAPSRTVKRWAEVMQKVGGVNRS